MSPVPLLTALWCDGNQLTSLDLSAVPKLTKLECGENQLTELNLSAVPKLTKLQCSGNQLTKLDIRPLEEIHPRTGWWKEFDRRKALDFDADKTRLIQRPDQNF